MRTDTVVYGMDVAMVQNRRAGESVNCRSEPASGRMIKGDGRCFSIDNPSERGEIQRRSYYQGPTTEI